jgi:hypothetical protein
MLVFQRFAAYGAAKDIYFTLLVPTATSSDRLYTSTAPATGDTKISKDGGATANTTNNPTHVGNGIWKLQLTSTEMQATDVVVTVVDADGPAFRDCFIHVQTKLLLGNVTVDATQIGGNVAGIYAKGVGTSPGLQCEGASDAYITNMFEQLEGSEPSSAPASNASLMAILQALKRRFLGKVETSSTTQWQYDDAGTSVIWSRTVSDDGTKQSTGKVS